VITAVTPSTAATDGPVELTIDGSAFEQGATVLVGGVAAGSVTVVSDSMIRAVVPSGPADIAGPTAGDVIVTNPSGSFATVGGGFTWTLSVPVIRGLTPERGPRAGGTIVTILGGGFSTATGLAVAFDGIPAAGVQIISPTILTATTPPHAAGLVDVTITASNGSAAAAHAFRYEPPPTRRRRAVRH
jgi:hypothetical protein